MKINALLMAAAVGMSACAAPPPARTPPREFYLPSAQELLNADHGPFPADYEAIVKAYMQRVLKDPESGRYRFEKPPEKFYTREYEASKVQYVYRLIVFINAKNSYGGYVGEHEYIFQLRDGKVINHLDATQSREEALRYLKRY